MSIQNILHMTDLSLRVAKPQRNLSRQSLLVLPLQKFLQKLGS